MLQFFFEKAAQHYVDGAGLEIRKDKILNVWTKICKETVTSMNKLAI